MFKSIFSKFFTVTAVIITCAFMLMAAAQAFMGGRYWVAEKKELLSDNAATVAGFLADNAVAGPANSYYLPDSLSPTLRRMATVADSSVLVVDTNFRVLLCSDGRACDHINVIISSQFHAPIREGDFFTVGHLGDLYGDSHYTAGVPMTKNGQIMGYVLVSSPSNMMQEYVRNNLRVSLLSSLAVMMVVFVVLYIMAYRLVRPLRQMAAATRQFGKGDFSGRVHVNSRDEVAELANAFNGMAASLSAEEEIRRSFVANVSHELKTPMTTISGFVDGMLDDTIPPEKHRHYLRIVSAEVKRLSRLVRAMLNLSRIDSGQLKLHPVNFDLTGVVCTSLLSFEQQIDSKNLQIEGLEDCEPLQVSGDYDLMQQVVYNLLENAVKFTNEGGTIRLSIWHAAGRTFCAVQNTGEGIPSTELPHIFERFYKSDRSRSLDTTGTGLGLYLVKSIINLHGGEITVRSVEHEYCEFQFWIPDGR